VGYGNIKREKHSFLPKKNVSLFLMIVG